MLVIDSGLVGRKVCYPRTVSMSVRNPSYMSRANDAKLVVDHFLRGFRLIKRKKRGFFIGREYMVPKLVSIRGDRRRVGWPNGFSFITSTGA